MGWLSSCKGQTQSTHEQISQEQLSINNLQSLITSFRMLLINRRSLVKGQVPEGRLTRRDWAERVARFMGCAMS